MEKIKIQYEKPKSFGMPVETYVQLKMIAAQTNRTMASVISELVSEKAAELNMPKIVVINRPIVGRPPVKGTK